MPVGLGLVASFAVTVLGLCVYGLAYDAQRWWRKGHPSHRELRLLNRAQSMDLARLRSERAGMREELDTCYELIGVIQPLANEKAEFDAWLDSIPTYKGARP